MLGLGTIISAGMSFISNLGPVAAKLGSALSTALKVVGNIMQVIGIFSGALKGQENRKIDDIGESVLQAAENGITRDKFPTHTEYSKAIAEQKIDPKKIHTESERFGAGIAFVSQGIEELKPNLGGLEKMAPLFIAQGQFFTKDRLEAYAKVAEALNYPLADIKGFFDGTSSMKDYQSAQAFLHNAEKAFNPETYNKDAFDKDLGRVSANISAML